MMMVVVTEGDGEVGHIVVVLRSRDGCSIGRMVVGVLEAVSQAFERRSWRWQGRELVTAR
jgi:hypothetical protein